MPNSVSMRRYMMWLLAALFLFYDVLLRVFPNIFVPFLQERFATNASHLGILSACFMYAYGIMQIPAGLIIDRLRLRWALSSACALAVVSMWAFSVTDNFFVACLARVGMGVGSAFAFLGCMQVIIERFPLTSRAWLVGWTMTIGALAGVFCNGILARVQQQFSPQTTLYIIVAIGALLMVCLWLGVRSQQNLALPQPNWSSVCKLLGAAKNWRIGLICAGIYLPYAILNDLWGMPFLRVVDHIGQIQAGEIISLIWVGWLVGSPVIGWLADRLGNDVRLMTWVTGVQAVLIIMMLWLPISAVWWLDLLGLAIGFCAASMALCYLQAQLHNPPEMAAASNAMVNTLVTVVVLVTLPIIGWSLDRLQHVGTEISLGMLHYAPCAYRLGLSWLILVLVLTFAALLYWLRQKDPRTIRH